MNNTTHELDRAERRNRWMIAAASAVGSVAIIVVAVRTSPDALRTIAGPTQVSAALRSCRS
jgi:hypothetical protein